MSLAEIEQPPLKKRRFFVEDSTPAEQNAPFNTTSSQVDALSASSDPILTGQASIDGDPKFYKDGAVGIEDPVATAPNSSVGGFDKQIFESFIGHEVLEEDLIRLQNLSDNDVERAINMYLDGSWMSVSMESGHASDSPKSLESGIPIGDALRQGRLKRTPSKLSPVQKQLENMPECRYIGAFGVGAWATRSGPNLLKHGESVKIERTKIKPPIKIGRGGKTIQPSKGTAARLRTDIIVRFTNLKGEEIGRLPKDTALWVSTLMDQKVCRFDGTCVFIPERVRVNDTIYLQLRCSLLKKAFEAGGFVKPEDNRTTGIFEEKETSEEKDLRLRQVALVKLFDEVNLHPSTINEKTAKHKREGILQAAEIAEQYDKENDSKKPKPSQDPSSSPPAGDEEEEGKELEQDQLDSLYKKAQSFDFDTPTREPTDTFTMDLRKYQKQALHWMMSKEKDQRSENKELSMHPLWEEYSWPVKDMNDEDIPSVINHPSFYVNPYSGELSLEFPLQEQHCLGGILADGKHCCSCTKYHANLSRNGTWQDH